MRWMLDTDTCIALIKRQPRDLIKRLQAKALGDVGVSTITLGELQFGAAKSAKPQQNHAALEQFLLPLDIASFDEEAAAMYGIVRATLERQGTPIGSLDMLIAAHALSRDVVLVTHNVREFHRVQKLRIEDWLKAA
jgi:tRNA(fMet)-specific endonuclease VapC